MIKQTRSTAARIRQVAGIMAMSLVPMALWAETDFTKAIPQDAIFAVWAADVPALKEAGKNSPYGRLFDDPATAELRAYFASKLEEWKTDVENPEEMEQFLQHLKGGAALYFSSQTEDAYPTLLMEADEEGVAWFNEQAEKQSANFMNVVRDSYQVEGVEVRRIQGTKLEEQEAFMAAVVEPEEVARVMQYAQVGNVFFITAEPSEAAVRALIARLKAEGTGALGERPEAAEVATHLGSSGNSISAFFNAGHALNSWVETMSEEDPMIRRKMQSLGALDVHSVYLTTTLAADKIDMMADLVTPAGRSGVLEALTQPAGMQLDSLSLAPSNVSSVTAFSFDLGTFVDAALKAADEFNPGSSMMFNMMVMSQQSELGVDILNGIIKNIAGEHLVVQRPLDPEVAGTMEPEEAAMGNSNATYLSLRNPQETIGTVKTLLQNAQENPNYGPMLDVSDHEGVTLVRMVAPGMEEEALPSLAITADRLIYANNDIEMQQALRAVTTGLEDNLADTADLSSTLKEIDREGLLVFTYSPAGAAAQSVEQFRSLISAGMFDQFDEEIDATIVPPASVVERYIGDSYMTINAKEGTLQINSVLRSAGQQTE